MEKLNQEQITDEQLKQHLENQKLQYVELQKNLLSNSVVNLLDSLDSGYSTGELLDAAKEVCEFLRNAIIEYDESLSDDAERGKYPQYITQFALVRLRDVKRLDQVMDVLNEVKEFADEFQSYCNEYGYYISGVYDSYQEKILAEQASKKPITDKVIPI